MRPRPLPVLLTATAATLLIAALARAPYDPPGADAALLRLSWRMGAAASVNCRPRTAQELEALPVHMRTPEVCERDVASHILVSRIDSLAPDTLHLARGGARGDRPLYVLEERVLEAGRRRLRLELYRIPGDGAAELLAGLDTVLAFVTGEVRLVTMNGEGRQLVVRSPAARKR